MSASVANSTVSPIYDLAANAAQLIVLAYGIYLVSMGKVTIGIVLAFFTYTEKFYYPLRQFATIWTSFQLSLAGWDRINEVLKLKSNLEVLPQSIGVADSTSSGSGVLLAFKDVMFAYGEKPVVKDVNFDLLPGKTYALVGPTGGGKTTTASLMARLFDPTSGTVELEGRDIRTYTPEERTTKIGFILQEPFLFNGTVRDNILYGNPRATSADVVSGVSDNTETNKSQDDLSRKSLEAEIQNLDVLLKPFEKGLDTVVSGTGEGMSLGQKQIIAFVRAILRKPDILILDEATANIDTVTESLLDEVLSKLPSHTTKVIIAHRLNTIKDADEIFFVGGGSVTPAGSFDHAMDMLLHNKRES